MPVHVADDGITVTCPEVHRDATMTFNFKRTLRVPDDGRDYGLPPGFGSLQIRESEGAHMYMMPMWQSEACWIDFRGYYPFLVTMSSGSINVVTGEPWSPVPDFAAEDYLEIPTQPWLDGFNVEQGKVKQFVAAPLGAGYTVEEQLSPEPARGGIQVAVYPMLASKYEPRQWLGVGATVCGSAPPNFLEPSMGLGAGGSITQTLATPMAPHDSWDLEHGQEFSIDIVNSAVWRELTGTEPASLPLSAAEYTRHGMPWFAWYDDLVPARRGSSKLNKARTISTIDADSDEPLLPENEGFEVPEPIMVTG
ncbi:MAG: hypothetical protein WBA00_13420 [Rhodococcus sp. (in: high G+C Gram-positive bacteria)]